MKSYYYNKFTEDKIIQYDRNAEFFVVSENIYTGIKNTCLDKKNMDLLIKFASDFKNIEIKENKTTFTVKNEIAKIKLQVCECPDYALPKIGDISIKVASEKLKNAMAFCGDGKKKLCLSGVNIEGNTITATDTLSLFRTTINNNPTEKELSLTSKIVPKEFLKVALQDCGETLDMNFSDKNVFVANGDTLYIGRLIAMPYPNISKIFEYQGNIFHFKKSELEAAVSYASLISDKFISGVRLENDVLSCTNAIEFSVKLDKNGEFKNGEYSADVSLDNLKKLLSAVKDEEIFCSIIDSKNPLIFNEEIVLMPIARRGVE